MNMTRKDFIGQALATGATALAGNAFGMIFSEKGKLPAGVDPHPLFAEDLPPEDGRRRQNQFLPRTTPDAHDFRFGPDGTFTFFHLSDIHLNVPHLGAREKSLLHRLTDEFHPSLAIVTGDNVEFRCRGLFEEMAAGVAEFFAEERLPFALTFGNHDTEAIGEGWYTAAEQWAIYARLAGAGFVDRHDPGVIGGGVSRISVRDAQGRSRFDLCVIDSGDYSPYKITRRTFDSVRAPMVAWARRILAEGVPALFFQHIIVPEANDALGRGLFRAAAKGEDGYASPYWPEPLVVDGRRAVGLLKEAMGAIPPRGRLDPLYFSEGESIYDVWRRAGNFRGAFFGHDHKNSFDGVTTDGVRLGMTKTICGCAYNDGDLALRVFRLHEDGTYETDVFSEAHPRGTGFFGRRSPLA